MRKLLGMSLLAILVATRFSAAQQQDRSRTANDVTPFVGTWKQNIAKSFYSDPYSAVIRIESAGVNRVKITQEVFRPPMTMRLERRS